MDLTRIHGLGIGVVTTILSEIGPDHAKAYFWLAWVSVALFSIGATEWMAPSEALNGFWRAFGNLAA